MPLKSDLEPNITLITVQGKSKMRVLTRLVILTSPELISFRWWARNWLVLGTREELAGFRWWARNCVGPRGTRRTGWLPVGFWKRSFYKSPCNGNVKVLSQRPDPGSRFDFRARVNLRMLFERKNNLNSFLNIPMEKLISPHKDERNVETKLFQPDGKSTLDLVWILS